MYGHELILIVYKEYICNKAHWHENISNGRVQTNRLC